MELAEYRAACVSRDELTEAELAELQDARDIALCEAIKACGEAGVPHDVFMASVGP
jgi:succinate dehydrogenase/fumarate reductase-like Fe-S protein